MQGQTQAMTSGQSGQTTTWKETCIEFDTYTECRLRANIYEIYWDFRSAKIISL